MIKIKLSRLWWAFLVALAASYPVSIFAAERLLLADSWTAPFLISWAGVWIFAAGGGICAGFVRIPDIDARFYAPMVAKALLGLFSGVALCSLIDGFTETQSGALTFFAFFASIFSAPLAGGVMVWLSNQKRIDSAMNQLARRKAGLDLSTEHSQPETEFRVDTDYKRSERDDSTDLS